MLLRKLEMFKRELMLKKLIIYSCNSVLYVISLWSNCFVINKSHEVLHNRSATKMLSAGIRILQVIMLN